MGKKAIGIGIVACVVALVIAGLSMAQPPAGGQGGPGGFGGPGGPGGRFDPEQMAQMRQRMMERMKEQLGADDAAWKVMEPRLTKVMELNRQSMAGGGRGGMFGMMGGMRGQRGGNDAGAQGDRRGPQQDPATMTPVEKAQEQLRTTLENQSASPDEIKKNLTALREAREKAKQELAAAQQELRQILTVRQEAQLVMMGQLQ